MLIVGGSASIWGALVGTFIITAVGQVLLMMEQDIPVFGTIASQFNDPGMNTLYKSIMDKIVEKTSSDLKSTFKITREMSEKIFVIPPHRTRYLSEIAEGNRAYDKWVDDQVVVAEKLYGMTNTIKAIQESSMEDKLAYKALIWGRNVKLD